MCNISSCVIPHHLCPFPKKGMFELFSLRTLAGKLNFWGGEEASGTCWNRREHRQT